MYAIVDIETTGGSHNDKITEIAIYIHDGTKIVDEFVTLLNPERSIPYFITKLTGINNEMVADAPKFFEVAKKIVEITHNKIFVAHNVSFDYNFVRNEFKSLGYDYKRKNMCTVKLSRKLIPALPSYSLGNLCADLGIEINGRHRAAGDAFATTKLFEYLLSLYTEKDDLFAQNTVHSLNSLHHKLDKEKIENLPDETGVYYFYDEKQELIYVGKSKNIYTRVLSHFNNNKSTKAITMRDQIADIDYELTGSELMALLIESEQIKTNKPLFNRSQRRTIFSYGLYSFEDENGYLCLKVVNTENNETPITCFNSLESAKSSLERLVDENLLCQKLSHTYKTDGACFNHTINQCRGACVGKESPEDYNYRVRNALKRFEFDTPNFYVIDKGRNKDEKSVIKIENGKYCGCGYIDISEGITNKESLNNCIKPYKDNRDVQQIIRNYLRKFKVEKIIR